MSCISDYQYDDRHGHAGWEQTMARDARLTTRPEDPRLLRDPAGQVQKVGRPRIWCCEHQNRRGDRKSTRLNSSHVEISYAVFCLKKKKKQKKKKQKTKKKTK